MDQFQMAIAVMAACDLGVGPRDAEGKRREYTAAELDTLAEFQLPGAGVVGRLATVLAAMQSRAIRRTSERMDASTAAAPAAATAARA